SGECHCPSVGVGRNARDTRASPLGNLRGRDRNVPLSGNPIRSKMRAATDNAVTGLAILATALVIAPLLAILGYLIYKGAASVNLDFFTKIPKPVGEEGGGMANAIVGSAVLLALGTIIGVPVGIGGGIYLAEFGRGTKLANAVRFTADVLNGVPSIVMGMAAYALLVGPQVTWLPFLGH